MVGSAREGVRGLPTRGRVGPRTPREPGSRSRRGAPSAPRKAVWTRAHDVQARHLMGPVCSSAIVGAGPTIAQVVKHQPAAGSAGRRAVVPCAPPRVVQGGSGPRRAVRTARTCLWRAESLGLTYGEPGRLRPAYGEPRCLQPAHGEPRATRARVRQARKTLAPQVPPVHGKPPSVDTRYGGWPCTHGERLPGEMAVPKDASHRPYMIVKTPAKRARTPTSGGVSDPIPRTFRTPLPDG